MNRKVLLANGCSMCYGSELFDDPQTKICNDNVSRLALSWPGKLGKKLGFQRIVNLGYPSGSNDRILRTSINWILESLHSKTVHPESLFVLIGWTNPMRREFYIHDEWRQLIPYHDYKDTPASLFNRVYRELAWSEFESATRFGTQVIALQQFLISYNIPYLFFDALTSFTQTNVDGNNALEGYFSHINKINYFNIEQQAGAMANVLGTSNANKNARHPDIEEHSVWADLLYDYITDKEIISGVELTDTSKISIVYEGTQSAEIYDKKTNLHKHPPAEKKFSRLQSLSDAGDAKSASMVDKMLLKIQKAFKKDPFIYE